MNANGKKSNSRSTCWLVYEDSELQKEVVLFPFAFWHGPLQMWTYKVTPGVWKIVKVVIMQEQTDRHKRVIYLPHLSFCSARYNLAEFSWIMPNTWAERAPTFSRIQPRLGSAEQPSKCYLKWPTPNVTKKSINRNNKKVTKVIFIIYQTIKWCGI